MAPAKKFSHAKIRQVAKALHLKADSRKAGKSRITITREMTATGRGLIRFRASHVLESLREKYPAKASPTR